LSNVLRQNRVTTHGSIVYSYIGTEVGFYELVSAAVVTTKSSERILGETLCVAPS